MCKAIDYWEFIEDLLDPGVGEDSLRQFPRPQDLMWDYDPYDVLRPGEITCVAEEHSKYSPEWRIFKAKDKFFKIECSYHPEYGYDTDYRFYTVEPLEETVTKTTWIRTSHWEI